MKKYNNTFLGLWMLHHKEFWEDLRKIERDLILHLIVGEKTVAQIAFERDVNQARLLIIIEALFIRIERIMGKDISMALRSAYDAIRNNLESNDALHNLPKIYWN